MSARTWVVGLFAAAAAWGAPAARAAEVTDPSIGPGKAYLVAVGVGEFKDAAIQPRPTADADAKALHALLTDPKVLGVDPTRAKLLTSKDATKEAVLKALEAGVAATTRDDLLIVALFGRGATVADKTCVFLPDSSIKDRAKTTLTTADLEPVLKKLAGQKLLVLVDVAFKGFTPADGEKVAEPTLRDVIQLVFGKEEGEENARPTNRVLAFGTLPDREAPAKAGHGLLYTVLADGLAGRADDKPHFTGYEPDGLVTAGELTKYLEKEIPNVARAVGKTDKEKEQIPFILGQATSRYWVSRNAAEAEKVSKRLEAVGQLAKDGKLTAEDAKEAGALLFRMPKLKWQQDLRKAYQELADGKTTPDAVLATRKTLKDGLKLPDADAADYAKKVSAWTAELSRRYIKAVTTGELSAAAIRGMFSRAEETLPADLADALAKAKELTRERQTELLSDARLRLGKREDLDGDKAVDVSLVMASASLNDPYAVYTDKEGVDRLATQLKGRFPGVGIQIRRDAVRDGLLVATPIKGSPAFKAGIQAGDLITEIRLEVDKKGNPLKPDAQRVFSTKGMKTEDAVNLILGEPRTPVTLVVQRDGEKDPKVFNLNRNFVMVETVHGVKRDGSAEWSYLLDEKYRIGYAHITQFISIDLNEDGKEEFGTVTDLKRAIDGLKKSGGLNAMVIDLRDNPGGYLSSAWHLCEALIDKGDAVVTVRPRAGPVREYKAQVQGDKSFAVVVLVNGNSASASEIVAACLQDHGRGTVVGEKTFGKGSVQDVVPFDPTGGELKYTIARYYPPSNRNIDKLATEQDPAIKDWGVKPNDGYEVKLAPEDQVAWAEYAQDLLVIPPAGKPAPAVNPDKDKQLAKGLDLLRELVRDAGKAPKG